MIVFTSHDSRFTRFIERNGHRLLRATICRVFGHRHSRYIWGMCDRCCTSYRRPLPLTQEMKDRSPRKVVRLPSESLLDSAWMHYLEGRKLPRAEAAEVWRLFNDLGESDDRVSKIVTLGRWVDHEASQGVRCSVCAGIDGTHDDC